MEVPKLGIIIPCYNHGQYIGQCLDSVFEQYHMSPQLVGNLYIAVIDNGDRGNSWNEIKKYFSSRQVNLTDDQLQEAYEVTLYKTPERIGAAGARNKGLELLFNKCDCFMFLDADDWLCPNVLSPLLNKLYEDPEYVMIYGDYYLYMKSGCYREYKETYTRKGLERECFINSPIVKKHAFEKVGIFDTELDGQEDYDMWLRATSIGLAYYMPQPILYARQTTETTYDRVSMVKYRKGMNRIYQKLQLSKQGAA